VDGLPTIVITHQLKVERRTGKVCWPETDVLPLCYATNNVHITSTSFCGLVSLVNSDCRSGRTATIIHPARLWDLYILLLFFFFIF